MFGIGKKKEEEKKPTCCCNAPAEPVQEESCCGGAAKVGDTCCPDGKMTVKVLGSGCKSCHALLEASREAVKNMGFSVEVEYVTDMERIMEYGVMSMPALVVNEKVVSMGKVLKTADVEKLLQTE